MLFVFLNSWVFRLLKSAWQQDQGMEVCGVVKGVGVPGSPASFLLSILRKSKTALKPLWVPIFNS